MNRHRALGCCLSMIFSENRFALFRIMLYGPVRATGPSSLPHKRRDMQTTADPHTLPLIECDGGRVAREHMQERNLAARLDLARDRREQRLRVAAPAMAEMNADGRHLGEI